MMKAFKEVTPELKFKEAVISGNLQTLKRLVSRGKIVDVRNLQADENGCSSLVIAAKYGHCDVSRFLLEAGHENMGISQDSAGNTIPLLSLQYKQPKICILYLKMYPKTISLINRDGQSPINLAAQNGYDEIINFILNNGGNVNQRDIDGNTPLHHAASWGQFSTVTILLKRGAQPGLVNHRGWSAYDYSHTVMMEAHIKEIMSKEQNQDR